MSGCCWGDVGWMLGGCWGNVEGVSDQCLGDVGAMLGRCSTNVWRIQYEFEMGWEGMLRLGLGEHVI